MTTVLPAEVTYGHVVGVILRARVDSNDPDTLPDRVPAQGTVTFTPQAAWLNLKTSTPPATVLPDPIEVTLGSDGSLAVDLIATDDPNITDLEPNSWNYRVDFKLLAGAKLPSRFIEVHGGVTTDITVVSPVPSATGVPYVIGPPGAGLNGPLPGTPNFWFATSKDDAVEYVDPFAVPGGTLRAGTPEQFVPDGDDATDPDYDWTAAANAALAAGRMLVGRYNKSYKISGRIVVDEGQYLGGFGGSARSTNLSSTSFVCTAAGAGVTLRSAGGKLVDVSVSGAGVASNPVKVGGTGTGDVGTSPYLANVTALLAAAGGKNFWISGAQNGVAIGCNSINSGGEGWTFTDAAAGWVLMRIESTGSAGPNLHITNCGAITFIRPTLERGLSTTGPDVLVDGDVTYPTIQMYHPQFASGGTAVSGVLVGNTLALSAAADTITKTAHGLYARQAVQLSAIVGATGVTAATTYYVLNPTADTFQLSATLQGTIPVNITADGTATVSSFVRNIIEHRANGYLGLDSPQFSGIDNEHAVGVYGDPTGADKFPVLTMTGTGSFTGANILEFADWDSRAIVDNRAFLHGVEPFGFGGGVPFRTTRSQSANMARTWQGGLDNFWRSSPTDVHKNLVVNREVLARFTELVDGTHKWALQGAAHDISLTHNALNSLNLQATTGAATLQVVGTVKAADFVPLRQSINVAADGALAIDASLGELVMVKLNGFNVTSISLPSNLQIGQKLTLWFKTGSTTPGTVTWPGLADGWIWDGLDANKPVLPTTSSTWCRVEVQVTDNGFLQEVSRDPSGRAPLASPAFTGVPTAPTPAPGTNTTQISTTAFVQAAVAALVNSSPSTLDTLKELADALGDDPNFATTMATALAARALLTDARFTDQRAPLDVSTWAAATNYVKGQLVLSPVGAYSPGVQSLVQAIASFTSGGAFSAVNWLHLGDLADSKPLGFDAPSGSYVMPANHVSGGTVALVAGSSGIASWHPTDLIPGKSYDALTCHVSGTAQVAGTTVTTLFLYADKNGAPDVAAGPVASVTVTLTATGNRVGVLGAAYTPSTAVRHWAGLLYVETVAPTTRATLANMSSGLSIAHDTTVLGGVPYRGWSATGLAAPPAGATALAGSTTPYIVGVRAA